MMVRLLVVVVSMLFDLSGSCDAGYEKKKNQCRPYAGSCKHGYLRVQKDRTQDDQCGGCDKGYYFQFPHCKGYAGSCLHGSLIAQKKRVMQDHCGSCDDGYHLDANQCIAFGGTCWHGRLAVQNERRGEDHCGSCNAGYHLLGHQCKPFAGSCLHGHPITVQEDRTRDNQCQRCYDGYYISYPDVCKPFGGSCLNGELIVQKDRIRKDQCGRCDDGYYLFGHKCKAYAGSCAHGHLVASQRDRTQNNQCGSCDGGYHLHGHLCKAYAGSCLHGTLTAQTDRNREDQCGSCNVGYGLSSNKCTGCNLLKQIYAHGAWDATMQEPNNLEGCMETAIFNLTKLKHFQNRRDFAVVLKKLNANFQGMLNGKTPVWTLVQHCYDSDNESDWRELRQLMWELVREHADMNLGSPSELAEKNGCPALARIIKQNSKPAQYFKRWDYVYNKKTPVFVGPYQIFSISLIQSLFGALVLGFVACGMTSCLKPQQLQKQHPRRSQKRDGCDPEQQFMLDSGEPGVGARELATLAHCHFWEERFQHAMCFLAVIAGVVFPIHVCMSTITPIVFCPLFLFTLAVPTLSDRKNWNYRAFDLAALILLPHGSCRLRWHAFAIARPIFLYTLSLVAATPDVLWAFQHRAELVPWWMRPWYWMRVWGIVNLQPVFQPVLHSGIGNIRCELVLNPFYLAEHESLFHVQWIQIPTREWFCCLEVLVGYLTVLWCASSLCLLIRTKSSLTHQGQTTCGVLPEVQRLALETRTLSDLEEESETLLKLSKLAGVKGALGNVEKYLLELEKKVACGSTSASDFALKDHASEAGNVERMFERNLRPYSKKTIWKEVILYFMDMILDLVQIHNLYWNGCHGFGGFMLFLFTWVLAVQLANGDMCTLMKEVEVVTRHGVKTDKYMRIMRWEKGFESFVGLMFTAYTFHFSVTTAVNLIACFASMFLSVYGFVIYIFHKGYLRFKYEALMAQYA